MRSLALLIMLLIFNSASAESSLFKGLGLVGDSLINIELTLSDDSSVTGFYEYSRFKKPIAVTGFHSKGRVELLADVDGIERFSLKVGDGQLNGTWFRDEKRRRVIARVPYSNTMWESHRTFEECLSSQGEIAISEDVSRKAHRTAKEVVELFRSGDKDELISRLSKYSQEEKAWLSKLPIELVFDESLIKEIGSADLPCASRDDGIMISRGKLWISDDGMIVNKPATEFENLYRPSPKILTYKGKIVPMQCLVAEWGNSDNFESLGNLVSSINDEISADLGLGSPNYLKREYSGQFCEDGECEALIPSLEQCVRFDGEYVSTGSVLIGGNTYTSESYILREKLDNEFCRQFIEESEFSVKHCIMIERFRYRGESTYEAFAISDDHYVIPLIEETSDAPLKAKYIEVEHTLEVFSMESSQSAELIDASVGKAEAEASALPQEQVNRLNLEKAVAADLEKRALLGSGDDIVAQSGLKVAIVYDGSYPGGNAHTPFLMINDGGKIYDSVTAGGIFDFSPNTISFNEDGDVVLEGDDYAEGDARCCPSLKAERVYGVRDSKVIRLK